MKLAHKLKGHLRYQGLDIAVEQYKGDVRSGTDADGKKWSTTMTCPYGYVVGSHGADGEGVDVFVGPDAEAVNAYVVHQKKDDGSYDEDKIVVGTGSKKEARDLYLSNYNTDKFLGPIHMVPIERLKTLLSSGKSLEKIASLQLFAFMDELSAIEAACR